MSDMYDAYYDAPYLRNDYAGERGTKSGRWTNTGATPLKSNTPKQRTSAERFDTVGVRFPSGHNIAKIYTYKVRKGANVKRGDELVVDTATGPAVVFVVRVDAKPDVSGPFNYVYATRKTVAL